MNNSSFKYDTFNTPPTFETPYSDNPNFLFPFSTNNKIILSFKHLTTTIPNNVSSSTLFPKPSSINSLPPPTLETTTFFPPNLTTTPFLDLKNKTIQRIMIQILEEEIQPSSGDWFFIAFSLLVFVIGLLGKCCMCVLWA